MAHALQADFDAYMKTNTAGAGFWANFPAYFVSLMRAWFDEHANRENDWCFHWLPAVTGDHSHMTTVADMADGKLEGYFVMGENPAAGSMNGALQRKGFLARTDLERDALEHIVATEALVHALGLHHRRTHRCSPPDGRKC